jgi:hypothetical protein
VRLIIPKAWRTRTDGTAVRDAFRKGGSRRPRTPTLAAPRLPPHVAEDEEPPPPPRPARDDDR